MEPLARVRLELGDETEPYLFTDTALNALLEENGGNMLLAAAAACDIQATRTAPNVDFDSLDQKSFKLSQEPKAWAARAVALRQRAADQAAGGSKSVGVMHVSRPRATAIDPATGRRPWRS